MLKASDCNFMFCLPLDYSDFLKSYNNSNKDFFYNHLKENDKTNWDNHNEQIVKTYTLFKERYKSFGFNFIERATFSDLSNCLSLYKVNIIFSHCVVTDIEEKEAIEFYDKMIFNQEFIDIVPRDYNKVIDLSVCNPRYLSKKLKKQRKFCIVKSSNKNLKASRWFYFYSTLFEIIKTHKMESYSNAIEETINQIQKT